MGIVTDLVIVVLGALAGGVVAHLCRQPLLFGYILAGILLGPHTGGPTVERVHDIEMLAEIGVALLLFTLGLEFSFGELKRLARIALFATPLQILLSAVAGYYAATALGIEWRDAVWIGGAVSLSSTMVVLKSLAARDELGTPAARVMFAILIAQDLAVIPLMLVLPQLTTDTPNFGAIFAALGKSALFLGAMYVVGTKFFPRLFDWIARWGPRELFFLVSLGIALGLGYVTYSLGLSFALGAFVAGIVLSESDFNHQALSDLSGLRDLFGLLFFASVGMLFDPGFFIEHVGTVLVLVAIIVACKACITSGVVKVFGFRGSLAITAGLGLSQVGEFAFLIANAGRRGDGLSTDAYSLMISVAVASMVLTPGLLWFGPKLYRFLRPYFPERRPDADLPSEKLSGHVVIVGGGTVGEFVARVLNALGRDYIVVESDYKSVLELRDKKINVLFGDGSHRVILEAAGISEARLVILSTKTDALLSTIVREVRELQKDVPIVVRVEEIADVAELSSLGVHEIVQPQLEVGLEMVRQALMSLGTDETRTFAILGELRAKGYELDGRPTTIPIADRKRLAAAKLLEFAWCEVQGHSRYCHRSIGEMRLRETHGINVVGVIRGEQFTASPGPSFTVSPGDHLGIVGTESQLKAFREGIS